MRVLILLSIFTFLGCSNSNIREAKLEELTESEFKRLVETEDSITIIENEEDYTFTSLDPVELKLIKNNTLSLKLQYDFFKTTKVTGYMEYFEVMVIMAIPRAYNKEVIEIKSLVFEGPNQKFLDIFDEMVFESKAELEQGIREISQLFESITYNGGLKKTKQNGNKYSVELWHNDRHWSTLEFMCDDTKMIELKIK